MNIIFTTNFQAHSMWTRYKIYLNQSPVHFFSGIAIPVTVFFWLLWLLTNLGVFNASYIWPFFGVPGTLRQFIYQPWSILTYPWIHLNIIGFLINLIILHFIGTQLEIYEPHKRMYRLAWAGIVGGVLAFWAIHTIVPSWFQDETNPYLTGLSVIYTAWLGYAGFRLKRHHVNMRLLGHWSWKALMWVFVLWDALQLPLANTGGHAAHLGAMLTGALWALTVDRVNLKKNTEDPPSNIYLNQKPGIEKIIDRILDKINRYGMDSLSEEEKEILYRESRRKNR